MTELGGTWLDFTSGNVAKYYVESRLRVLLAERPHTILVDLGCSTAEKWNWLYESPLANRIEFVGFDLDEAAIAKATAQKPRWRFFAEPAYRMNRRLTRADVLVSYSTLEHVYRRRDFLRSARSLMDRESVFFLNYDNGHFFGLSEWKRNVFGPLLARLGIERYYQSLVGQDEIELLLSELTFEVTEELNFHQAIQKKFLPIVRDPPDVRRLMEAALTFELVVNELLQRDPVALKSANSNQYLLSKLFILRVSRALGGG